MGPNAGLDCGRITRLASLRFEFCFLGYRGKESEGTTRGW